MTDQAKTYDEARGEAHAKAIETLRVTSDGWETPFASGSNGGDCFEFNFGVPGWVGLRDSKLGAASPVLAFTKSELEAMLAGARAGQFDNRIQ